MRNADTLLDQALNQHVVVNDDAESSALVPLSPEKIARITAWVDKQKELHNTLDIEAYVKSVVDEDKRRKKGEKVKSGRSKGQQINFLLSLSILCMGGMFSVSRVLSLLFLVHFNVHTLHSLLSLQPEPSVSVSWPDRLSVKSNLVY